jgi:DNA-binding response OmpR family regulator
MRPQPKDQLKFRDVLYIAEDDLDYLKVDRILNRFFQNIYLCEDEKSATKTYIDVKPSVIVADTKIGTFDVLSFIKKIRKIDENISIIFVSRDLSPNTLLEVIRLNVIDYIPKPVEVGKVIYAINLCAKKLFHQNDGFVHIGENIQYDHLNSSVITNGETKKLTKKEMVFLELLLNNKNRTVSMEEIFQHVWSDSTITESAFKSMYNRFSNKIGKNIITNNFGIGYGIFDNK